MLVKRSKWIRSVNNGHEEMIKEVRVVYKGMRYTGPGTSGRCPICPCWTSLSTSRRRKGTSYSTWVGIRKRETDKCMLVAELRLKQVVAGQLELARADIEATQSRPCRDKCWTTWVAAMPETILCQDLHTMLAVAC